MSKQNHIMNKQEFVDFVVTDLKKLDAKAKIKTKQDVLESIDLVIDHLTRAFRDDKGVQFIGFGKFYISHVEAKEGRNPQTGKPLKIPAHNRPKFTAGEKLKAACNE